MESRSPGRCKTRKGLLRSGCRFVLVSKRLLETADKHAPCLFIRAGKERLIDVKDQARRIVMPVQTRDLCGRNPRRLGLSKALGAGSGQDKTLIQFRPQDIMGIDDPVQPRREPLHCGLFAVDQES